MEVLQLLSVTLSLTGLLLECRDQVILRIFRERHSFGPSLCHLASNTQNSHGLVFMPDGWSLGLERVPPTQNKLQNLTFPSSPPDVRVAALLVISLNSHLLVPEIGTRLVSFLRFSFRNFIRFFRQTF